MGRILKENKPNSIVGGGSQTPAWRRRKPHRAEEILQAARSLLEECGYENASLTEIARRAGVSEATIYNYFDGKHDLMHRVVEAWMKPPVEALERDVWLIDGAGPRLRLLAMRHLHELVATPLMHRVIYSELRWADYPGSRLHRLNRRYTHIVVSILQEGIRDGELDQDINLRIARDQFFGGLEHTGWRLLLLSQPFDLEATATALVSQFTLGLGRRHGRHADATSEVRLSTLVNRLEGAVETMEVVAAKSR